MQKKKNGNLQAKHFLKGVVLGPLFGLVCISPLFEKPYMGLLYGLGVGLLVDLFLKDKYAT